MKTPKLSMSPSAIRYRRWYKRHKNDAEFKRKAGAPRPRGRLPLLRTQIAAAIAAGIIAGLERA